MGPWRGLGDRDPAVLLQVGAAPWLCSAHGGAHRQGNESLRAHHASDTQLLDLEAGTRSFLHGSSMSVMSCSNLCVCSAA